MTLANQSMERIALHIQNRATLAAMADVGQCSVTIKVGRMGFENADVVQHGGLVKKAYVRIKCWMAMGNLHRQIGNSPAMLHKDLKAGRLRLVIIRNNLKRIHANKLGQ